MNTDTDTRKAALMNGQTTASLLAAARLLEANKSKTPDERMVAAWILDEIENRVGLITDDESAEFERVYDQTDSYIAALIHLRPALANI